MIPASFLERLYAIFLTLAQANAGAYFLLQFMGPVVAAAKRVEPAWYRWSVYGWRKPLAVNIQRYRLFGR